VLGWRAEDERRRLKAADTNMPMPPGITYWRTVKVKTADGQVIETAVPLTKPLRSLEVGELVDGDIINPVATADARRDRARVLKPGGAVPVSPLPMDAGTRAGGELLQAAP
jgi:hypothetical protein